MSLKSVVTRAGVCSLCSSCRDQTVCSWYSFGPFFSRKPCSFKELTRPSKSMTWKEPKHTKTINNLGLNGDIFINWTLKYLVILFYKQQGYLSHIWVAAHLDVDLLSHSSKCLQVKLLLIGFLGMRVQRVHESFSSAALTHAWAELRALKVQIPQTVWVRISQTVPRQGRYQAWAQESTL